MKAKVIIENGEITIELTPQNDFEVDIIDKICNNKNRFTIFTSVDRTTSYGVDSNHKIEMSIKETK